jgi:hypothetical protein
MLKELPMQTTLQSPLDAVINWSIPGQLVDQFPAAVVVVKWPPFRGPLITCRPRHRYCPPMPIVATRWRGADLGYAIAERAESIIRQKRHGSTAAGPNTLLIGDSNVLS